MFFYLKQQNKTKMPVKTRSMAIREEIIGPLPPVIQRRNNKKNSNQEETGIDRFLLGTLMTLNYIVVGILLFSLAYLLHYLQEKFWSKSDNNWTMNMLISTLIVKLFLRWIGFIPLTYE